MGQNLKKSESSLLIEARSREVRSERFFFLRRVLSLASTFSLLLDSRLLNPT